MKRSSSASIVSDNRFVCSSSSLSLSSIFRSSSVSSGLESEPYLPTFSPFSHAAEKKRRHLKLAKIFIHSIPFVILFCAIVLWLFSDPGMKAYIPQQNPIKIEGQWVGIASPHKTNQEKP
ncbi:uncharacterized protein LOC101212731 isoform X2 [Cucumis sativus]|uniref:uncharacterized protein LOC101212731 isoform X2 n=1 Tax=Cucumis sativus TaxID=3659 RepID=UPI0002B488DC|nr:uncharacterized protein LOC101212731 isoform X2 [Cucumis sativus]